MAEPDNSTASPPPGNTNGANAPKPSDPSAAFREMLDALNRNLPELRERDPNVAQTIRAVIEQAADPLRANQREFRHDAAYAVQDTEKALGHQLQLSANGRTEVDRLAGSAPGLENDRLLALLRSTVEIGDANVVHDIRHRGAEIGRQADQNTETIRSQIDVLENQARKAPRAQPPSSAPVEQPSPPGPADATADGDQKQAGSAPRTTDQGRRQQQTGSRYGTADPAVYQQGIIDGVISGIRGALAPSGPAPWDAAAQPFGERLTAFQAKMREGRDVMGLRDAEQAGRTALDALEGFRAGEGATVMNRIQSAARADPQGISGVLSEMREGGRFQDLRQQFNNALKDETGFARAYDQAAEALAKYGQARTGVEQIIAHRPDAANLSAKFQQLDAEIGEAAGGAPSRREGKAMLDDMSKQAGEIIKRAVDAVKSLFTGSAPEPNRPGPSPS